MANREAYYERLTARGKNRRERQMSWLRRDISEEVSDLLSYRTVQLRGKKVDMVIESTEVASTKKFIIPTDVEIGYGDYIVWDDVYWIVTERDFDDEIYIKGKMAQCNYYLKWQNETGEIIGRWCVINQVTRYNNGVFYGKVIDNIESTISVMIINDEETAKLKREKRFLADVDDTEPYAFKITQRDVLTNYYGSSGLIVWAISQDVFNPETDNKEFMIADYQEGTSGGIEGADEIRIGHSAVYTSSMDAAWALVGEADVILEISGDAAVIKVPKERDLIGRTFTLTDGQEEKTIRICAVY